MRALMARNKQKKEKEATEGLTTASQEAKIKLMYNNISMPETGLGPPEIAPHELEIEKAVGDGSFGVVYKGRCREKVVAIKKLLKQDLNAEELAKFKEEIRVLSSIFHPNICLFMGAVVVPGELSVVTELLEMDLESILQDSDINLTMLTRMRMAKDAALGLNWLHEGATCFVHRDLKTSNLLVDSSLRVKVSDFGLTTRLVFGESLRDEGEVGSLFWMAPELLLKKEYNHKVDIYSFGIVLWELVSREEPYEEEGFDDIDSFVNAVCNDNVRPVIPNNTNPQLRELIEKCWAKDPEERPSARYIVATLDKIIVDYAIRDPVGRKFWTDCFLKKASGRIHWKQFMDEFGEAMEIHSSHIPISDMYMMDHPDVKNDTHLHQSIECLKILVARKEGALDSDLYVSIEDFGSLLDWFGPLELPNEQKSQLAIFEKIRDLMSKPWFHGDITTREAENRLSNKIAGTFLVRFSTRSPGAFTISKVSRNGKIHHQRIAHNTGEVNYTFGSASEDTIPKTISSISDTEYLMMPCAGSRFLNLFIKSVAACYVGTT